MKKRLLNSDTGAFVLRLSLGTVLLTHSLYLKLMVFTLAGTAQFFASIGLPETLAYIVFIFEVITGTALLLGFNTRLFSALIIPILLGSTWAHAANGWLFTNTGGGWEYPLFLTLMALVQLSLGDGRYAISSYFDSKIGNEERVLDEAA
ncbi:DoxX family protein [Motilimonas sp. 1_MG-2023]|uniref:DoxX family protein n=1 Tax=Motilimonas sp. 1_MG-2023 TaxID=3062672 RepID=UPI0026E2D6AE|nr:DoxX family protein [Motilimonas sp. 1_MG-2023]MDO6527148.1 DoxX family protein [Motilimonas sp. 1_MG-2023]